MTAVEDLSFTVEEGQIYGFLGPNGAGKSTTMNMMTGYIAMSAGTVTIQGHDIMEEPQAARRCMGYLPEQPPVYPDLTVREYLDFAAGLKKIPARARENAITEAMSQTDILDMAERLIRNLSKGYRQRVGLAQALLGAPEVLILDEPMVGLDPKQIVEIRELIQSLGKKHTIILSSHILSEIRAICDHIMIISHGRLVASDTPDRLLQTMTGAGSLDVTLKADEAKAGELLSSFGNDLSFSLTPSSEEGCVSARIQLSREEPDIREQLFYHCAQEKVPILEMTRNSQSLEEVFLELTEEDEPAGTQAGKGVPKGEEPARNVAVEEADKEADQA